MFKINGCINTKYVNKEEILYSLKLICDPHKLLCHIIVLFLELDYMGFNLTHY